MNTTDVIQPWIKSSRFCLKPRPFTTQWQSFFGRESIKCALTVYIHDPYLHKNHKYINELHKDHLSLTLNGYQFTVNVTHIPHLSPFPPLPRSRTSRQSRSLCRRSRVLADREPAGPTCWPTAQLEPASHGSDSPPKRRKLMIAWLNF